MEILENLNWLSVLGGAAGAFVTGALWYSPMVFGMMWQDAVGKKPEDLGNPIQAMGHAAVISLVAATAMAILQHLIGVSSIAQGIFTGLGIGVGFVFAHEAKAAGFTGKSRKLVLIDGGAEIAGLAVMGGLIAGLP